MGKSRRANGEGTIGKRKSDGRWFATVPIGRDADGRVRRRTEYARTKAEAAEKLARMRSSVIDGTMVQPTRQRLAQYLDRWLLDSSRPSTSKNTYRLYESVIRIHINPRIGGVRLSNVGPQHVQALMAEMERGGASPRVRQLTLGLLRNALSRAVKWNLVARNPCLVVDRPPAGLSSGWALEEMGRTDFSILEKSSVHGGNARTVKVGDFRYDTGPHRFHARHPEATRQITELMGADIHEAFAPARIYWEGRFIDFPLRPMQILKNGGIGYAAKAAADLMTAVTAGSRPVS